MNFKLALKNVRKSLKDYAIYFLTLSFAVCIFYAFNSIGAQSKILNSGNNGEIVKTIGEVIGYISVFVSVVLGCLIIYANNFLIKRRKRELGLYMSLGMGKRKISTILVLEELIIGVFSLICGLVGGIVLSQLLGVLTTKLFGVSIKNFKLVFSANAMIKSIVYFGIIFILVMIFNVIVVSRYKLIDLLTAHRKNEKIKVKSPVLAGIIFLISLIVIGVAYYFVIKAGFNPNDSRFGMSIVLGVIGTLLFFYGLTGFLILLLQRSKNMYYKKLNIFTVRQMNSKINTNFISMAVICLMIFITVSLIAVSVGFKNQNISQYTPFSATILSSGRVKDFNLEQGLKSIGFKLPEGSKMNYITEKTINGITYKSEFSKYADSNLKSSYLWKSDDGSVSPIDFLSLTDYNNNLKLQGKEPITLNQNQVLITSNSSLMKGTLNNFFKENGKIKINNKEYTPKGDKALDESLTTNQGPVNFLTIIVNDNLLDNAEIDHQYININYNKNNITASENYIQNLFKKEGYIDIKNPHGKNSNDDIFVILSTKIGVMEQQNQLTTMILYIALYIGAIFLVSSAAVLALQQLSEASDSYDRYKALRKIGASDKQINKSIFTQTLAYFGLPLILALVHAGVGIYVSNGLVEMLGKSSIFIASIWTMVCIVIIYLGYFIVTYLGYKNIVKEK
ncbi:hypothetical protein HMPREF1092_00257 [Clostridium thermobutyricum]|uniref:ABC3 transporter permease C-terminal domain-containing protein n=1 Tax=Clostridium thermobutyricum TaxID=29372 RepID=N9WJ05_9CLOT|nr:ABC transporter permease [Clostridium thermobutyricum]ENZ03071.1 hypothetical protein HMPREF1092_00257 [Clostridium thermobutyricum]